VTSLSGVGAFFVYMCVYMVFCVYVYVCGASKHAPTTDRDEMRLFYVFMRLFFVFMCMYMVRQDAEVSAHVVMCCIHVCDVALAYVCCDSCIFVP